MKKKTIIKVAVTIVAFIVPFGMVTLGGYHAIKAYKKRKSDKDRPDKENKK